MQISQRDVAPHGMAEYSQMGIASGQDMPLHQPMQIEEVVLIGFDKPF